MKRTTIMLPEDLLGQVRNEARRRGVSLAEVVREAIERQFPPPKRGQPLSFFAIGEGGPADASERVDEYVRKSVRKRLRR